MEVSGTGPVFHRERVLGPGGAWGWLAGVVTGVAITAAAAALGSLGTTAAIAAASVVGLVGIATIATAVWFRRLTIVVDREGIAWSFGPLVSCRFSHAEVVMFRARDFAFRKAGGWGIGRAHDGLETYQVWGRSGDVLDIVVKSRGVTRHFLVSTAVPELVCAALVRGGTT